MIKKSIVFLTALLVIISFSRIKGQEAPPVDFPKVGDTVADHRFTDLDNFSGQTFKISDFRGKWVIIDFWGRGCAGCVASFPKMDTLYRQFKDQVEFLLVGICRDRDEGSRELTEEIFQRMKTLHNLLIPTAYCNSATANKYDIPYLPFILVIDPEGVIRAKTTSVNADQISRLLEGESPRFKRAFSLHEKLTYDRDLPLLTAGTLSNGGKDTSFLFRSMLVPYNYSQPTNKMTFFRNPGKSGRLETFKISVERLYLLAYFGAHWWAPTTAHPLYGKYCQQAILNVADSSDFEVDYATLKGLYSYSSIVPKEKSSNELLKKILKSDLENYFGYQVSIEDRMMPAYFLIVTDKEKTKRLMPKGGKTTQLTRNIYAGFDLEGIEIESVLLGYLKLCTLPGDGLVPWFDKTGINHLVDIKIKADMLYLESVNTALAYYGLKIQKGQKKMKTLIIKDAKE